jgi:hypothetical protein
MTTTTDDFTRGVNWGKFVASMFDDDDPSSDGARMAVLDAIVGHLEDNPNPELIDVMTRAWFDYRCHGRLKDGEACSNCGAYDPGDDA